MDYLKESPVFKARKIARYVQLYGPARTATKVRAQLHMRGDDKRPARLRPARGSETHVGIIGSGTFAYTTIAYYLTKAEGPVIRAAMDRHKGRAASLARRYRLQYATDDASDLITDPEIDLIYVASNHASHAEYAVAALRAGKNVHVEKPHVVSEAQLRDLCAAMDDSPGGLRIGFNRPASRLGLEVKRLLDAEAGQSMFNWFVAGHEIAPDHWYYKPEEGGRVLGNLCHWTDFVLQMVPPEHRFPIEIHPTRGQKADSDIAVTYVFGDGTIAAITFSAKGHTFEGVREHLSLHRGNLLLSLRDFQELRAHVREKRYHKRLIFRDHGHAGSVLRSYAMTKRGGLTDPGSSRDYVWQTGQLFLKTRDALERDRIVKIDEPDSRPVIEPAVVRAS